VVFQIRNLLLSEILSFLSEVKFPKLRYNRMQLIGSHDLTRIFKGDKTSIKEVIDMGRK